MANSGDKFEKAHSTRRGDFPLKYPTLDAIEEDKGLTPDEQLREKVKHLSMQMFGLAIDLANQEKKFNMTSDIVEQKDKVILKLRAAVDYAKKRYSELWQKYKDLLKSVGELREQTKEPQAVPYRINDLTSEERQAIQADYYEKRLADLKSQVAYRNKKVKELEERLKAYEDTKK